MTTYPAVMTFKLSADRPYRQQVLDAAARLGLPVTIGDGDCFDVELPDHVMAYRFGEESKHAAPRKMVTK